MADETDKESKTEEATQRRKDDTINKGNTPVSREVGPFTSILALAVALPLFGRSLEGDTLHKLAIFLDRPHEISLETSEDLVALFSALTMAVAPVVAIPVLIILAFGLAGSLLQNPPQISIDRIKPDFSRVSPTAGFKRIYGSGGRVEFMKSVAKLMIMSVVVYSYISHHLVEMLTAHLINPHDLPKLVIARISGLAATVAACLAFLVAADLVWIRFKWNADLRMSKQDIKDEHKQAEGDPIVRARQRSIARDRARRRMMAAVPRATMVVANPTHYAVALRYVRGESDTPVVVAKGLDNIAVRIRAIAEEHGIPVIEDKALARSLHAAVVTDRPIPPEFYKAIAEIIMFLMARGQTTSMQLQGKQ